MQPAHRRILKMSGQVALGLIVGAVCGFALLSVGFVLRNQYASPGIALVVVLLAAGCGGGIVGYRLWRERAVPATEPDSRPASVRSRLPVPRFRKPAVSSEPSERALAQQGGVGAVPDAA